MRSVAVLGGGPAGAFTAERLARGGLKTILIDEKLAWEKPCGGGLTWKAYNEYPFLLDSPAPKRIVERACLASPGAGMASLTLTRPIVIYSRFELNNLLLNRAEAAGAAIEKTRVLGIERHGQTWKVLTRPGGIEVDYCVIATGARNNLRDVGTEWSAANTMTALGYFIPINQPHIDIRFFPSFEGYIWVFPRKDHLSAGICGKGLAADAMRARLDRYLRSKGIPMAGAQFYAHVLPSLEKPAWQSNRVAGEGWMAVGDAAGLVDPVTGEGLYYAMRSADLASRTLLADVPLPSHSYGALLRKEFTDDLELGSRLAKRLYSGKFLLGDVPDRMIQLMRRSPTFRAIMQDLFAGNQNYVGLRPRLLENLNSAFRDIVLSTFTSYRARTV
jgi:flavin-dependent dehydrogenase